MDRIRNENVNSCFCNSRSIVNSNTIISFEEHSNLITEALIYIERGQINNEIELNKFIDNFETDLLKENINLICEEIKSSYKNNKEKLISGFNEILFYINKLKKTIQNEIIPNINENNIDISILLKENLFKIQEINFLKNRYFFVQKKERKEQLKSQIELFEKEIFENINISKFLFNKVRKFIENLKEKFSYFFRNIKLAKFYLNCYIYYLRKNNNLKDTEEDIKLSLSKIKSIDKIYDNLKSEFKDTLSFFIEIKNKLMAILRD
jgi:hypothetical protein